jgi:hypothetical protein
MTKAFSSHRRLPLANKIGLWRLLAGLLVLHSIIFFGLTQPPGDVLFAVIVWWGAYLSLDIATAPKRLLPSPIGA